MKKYLILFVSVIFCNITLVGQNNNSKTEDSVYFDNCISKIQENDFRNNTYTIDSIKLIYSISKDTVVIDVKYNTSSCKKKIIPFQNNIVLLKGKSTNNNTAYIIFEIQNDSLINDPQDYFIITLSSKDSVDFKENNHIVEIEEYTHSYDPDDLYKFALGANFDFADGIKPRSFYAELSTFQPDLIFLKKDERINKNTIWFRTCGLYGGIYQNRNFSPDSNVTLITSFNTLNNYNDSLVIS